MAVKLFTDLLLKAKFEGLEIHGDKARKWFKKQIQEIKRERGGKIEPHHILREGGPRLRERMYPGHFYLFTYDPKWRMQLPYYDRAPVALILADKGDRYLGLNFHYLPHPYRAKLLDALYEIRNTKGFTERTKIMATYQLLKSVPKYKYFRPTIKWYLKKHIRSRAYKILPSEWEIILFLPIEKFEKKLRPIHKYKVWQDSRKIIQKYS